MIMPVEQKEKKNDVNTVYKLMGPSKRPTCIMNVPKERIRKNIWRKNGKYSQNLKIDMNLQIQESQWTPRRINSEAHTETYYNQTGKRQGQRQSWKQQKRNNSWSKYPQ